MASKALTEVDLNHKSFAEVEKYLANKEYGKALKICAEISNKEFVKKLAISIVQKEGFDKISDKLFFETYAQAMN